MDQVPSGVAALTDLIVNINMKRTEDAAFTAVRVLTVAGVHTRQTVSTETATDVAAFIAALLPMEADVHTAQAEHIPIDIAMNPEAEEFLRRLREANAEDLRNRILERVRTIIEQAGLSSDRLSQVEVDVSDYLNQDQNQ